MAYTVQEFLELDLSKPNPNAHEPTQEDLEDLYYDELGRIVDQHPVGLPFVRLLA